MCGPIRTAAEDWGQVPLNYKFKLTVNENDKRKWKFTKKRIHWEGMQIDIFRLPDRYLNFTEEETKDQRHRITCQRSKVADVQSYLTPHPNTVPWSMLPCHFLCLTCKLPKAAISSYLFSNFIYLSLIYTADWSVIGTTCVQPQYILEFWKICTLFDSAISCAGNYTEEKK